MSDDGGLEFHQTVSAEQEWLEDEEAQREYQAFLLDRDRERWQETQQAIIETSEDFFNERD